MAWPGCYIRQLRESPILIPLKTQNSGYFLTCSHQMWSCPLAAACWMQDESKDQRKVKKKGKEKKICLLIQWDLKIANTYHWWLTGPPNYKPQFLASNWQNNNVQGVCNLNFLHFLISAYGVYPNMALKPCDSKQQRLRRPVHTPVLIGEACVRYDRRRHRSAVSEENSWMNNSINSRATCSFFF